MIDYKQLEQFQSMELIAKQVVEGFITGLHKSPFHGFSVEFAEHRLYNQGESIKNIDWKLYGRTDKLFVKKFEEETNLRCHILMDISSSMYFPLKEKLSDPNKITFSVYAAAALMYLLTRQRDAVALSAFSDHIAYHTSAKSSSTHLHYLYGLLETLLHPYEEKNMKPTGIMDALHQLSEQIHKRSLIILFTDMFEHTVKQEELFYALQHLKHKKNEIILFHVTDHQKEIDFNYKHRPYQFIDMETGETVKLNPAEIRSRYVEKIKTFTQALQEKCQQYHIDFIDVDIHEGFYPILQSYLIKRQKMM